MLEIQKFLRNAASSDAAFEMLNTLYGISAKRHTTYANLVLFKYEQRTSPFGQRIVQECRGIILDETDGWRVVSRSFDKFFNYGEVHAVVIDWTTATVQEKKDGSLCTLYPYDGKWHVATSGMAAANGPMEGGGTFLEAFWETYLQYEVSVPSTNCGINFMFELTTPKNRIVVVHDSSSLTVLGGRIVDTGKEIDATTAARLLGDRIPAVSSFSLTSIDEILSSFGTMSPLKQEGYVIVDGAFCRVKVKHPGYVALHHAKDGMSAKAFVQIARSGEASEVVVSFPEFRPLLDDAKDRFDSVVSVTDEIYEVVRHIQDRKEFALAVKHSPYKHALFAIHQKKSKDARAFYTDMMIDNLMSVLGYK